MGKLKFRDYVELIKLLRIDVFFLLAVFGAYMPSVTVNQLAQDKFCINTYSVNQSICMNLENSGTDYESLRNKVLEKGTTLKMYTTIITSLPGFFFALVLGYWMDTYPGHIRYLLGMVPFSMVIQNLIIIYQCFHFEIAPISLLYAYIAPALSGSLVVIMTGSYTYTTRKTPAKYRALRFAILELFLFVAIPLSTIVGGAVLAMEPWFPNQPRNYIGVFLVSTISATFAGIWVCVLLDDAEGHDPGNEKVEKETREDGEESEGKDEHDLKRKAKQCDRGQKTAREIFLDIFNVRNILSTFYTAFKRRDHNGRFCLHLIMVSMAVCMIGYMGENSIGFQYSQRVYKWSAEYYSYMSASIISIPAIVTVVTPPILLHKFHLHDTAIGILGSVSLAASMFARGLVLSAPGFFIGVVFGSFVGLLPIANRSIISRIIRINEIGQIYAILSCIESAGPLISSVFYSKIFNATIENSPGTVYIAAGFVVVFPASVMIWLYYTRNTWDLVLRAEAEAKATKEPQDSTCQSKSESSDSDDYHNKSTPRVQSRVIYQSQENIVTVHTDHVEKNFPDKDSINSDEDDVSKLESTSTDIVLGTVEIVIEKTNQ
ncbi:uncharacterized protein LOC128387746 [Panonychus citri]|uniref:uncharacterized protein LOC128387746 n=1 Tax=Panonychus citri TaxID=50023 RepID=UPI00230786D1|nr:uncharacterized protein LOC128387746 [Panonychus citri]